MSFNPEEVATLFGIPRDVTYLNVAGVGPLLLKTVMAGEHGLKIKNTPWLMGEFEFFDQVNVARDRFAQLVGAVAKDIAIIPSATYGVESALLNAKIEEGDEILVQAEEFPSIILPAKKLCDEVGAQLKTVGRPADFDWTTAVCHQINEKTKVVAVSPCHWIDGSLLDLVKVGEKARAVGALFLVDACQAAGAFPLNVRDFQPDFLVAPTYKWLLGPYSYGFLYVHSRYQSGVALEQYWASRKGARDFSQLTQYSSDYEPGAIRYDMGERSQFINTPMAISALEQILEWGPDFIAGQLQKMTDAVADRALAMGWRVPPARFRAPHFIGIRSPKGFSPELSALLAENKVFVSFRGDCLRVAPHLYNEVSDIDRLFEFLSSMRDGSPGSMHL